MKIRLPRHDDEDGFTLTEVLVAMGLLTIFMTIFTTVTLMMTNTTTKVQRITGAVTQANQAFIAIDRSARYASAISIPAPSAAGTWHVEWDTYKVDGSTGRAYDQCTQLKIANRQLLQRTWEVSGTSYATGTLTSWKPIANNVLNGSVANTAPSPSTAPDNRPFLAATTTAGATSAYQRLTVTIIASGDDSTTSLTSPDANRATMTIAAVNSVAGDSTPTCQQVAVDSTS